jgi:hypothetical protein
MKDEEEAQEIQAVAQLSVAFERRKFVVSGDNDGPATFTLAFTATSYL